MKWFDAFLKRISESFPARVSPEAVKQLARIDPERISLENVRSVLGVSASQAQRVVDTAVRRGVMTRRLQVYCPDGSVAVTVQNEEKIPPTVRCWRDDDDFEMISTEGLMRMEVYSFHG